MLYIIKIDNWNKKKYRLIDTNTDSVLEGSKDFVRKLVRQHKFELANAKIVGKNIILNEWPISVPYQGYDRQTDNINVFMLLSKVGNDRFKLVQGDGKITYINEKLLRIYTKNNIVANCYRREANGKEYYGAKDAIAINTDKEFIEQIEKQYKLFISKSTLMGADMRFEYIIEGTDVRLDLYTGTSKKIILPNFITSIGEQAFFDRGMEEVVLNNGLKYIGSNSFKLNKLRKIEIPESVEYVGQNVFMGNDNLSEDNILRNSNTMILEEIPKKIPRKQHGFGATMKINSYEKRDRKLARR